MLHLCMCSACFLQLAAGVVGSCGTGKAGYKQQEGTEADLLQDVELLAKAACLKRSAENTRPTLDQKCQRSQGPEAKLEAEAG